MIKNLHLLHHYYKHTHTLLCVTQLTLSVIALNFVVLAVDTTLSLNLITDISRHPQDLLLYMYIIGKMIMHNDHDVLSYLLKSELNIYCPYKSKVYVLSALTFKCTF